MEEEEIEPEATDKTASSPPHDRRTDEVGREANWRWKRQQLQGVRARIRLSYKRAVFEDIQSVLEDVGGKELLQQFVDGCFGHLIHLVRVTSCTEALHELIGHEIILPSAPDDELWFCIGGTNIRFSPEEYALVTGLRFGSSSFDPHGTRERPKDGVCKQFFSKRGRPITVEELWKKFKLKRLHISKEDYLRVAHILSLYLVALGYMQTKSVDQWVWVLAEDLDSWNRFPWGAYTYQALMHYVGLLPTLSAGSGQRYIFRGPAWALQIWGYEAIPQLGNTCAISNGQITVPRCCKWSSRSGKIDLTRFFKKELKCYEKLDPTDEEKLQPYWLSLQCTERLGVRYNRPQRTARTKRRTRALLGFDERVLSQKPRSSSAKHDVPIEVSDSDDSSRKPAQNPKRTRVSTRSSGEKNDSPHRVPQGYDEACFFNQVSDRMVDRLIEPVVERLSQQLIQLIPQMKQLIELRQSPSQPSKEVHDQLEMVLDSPFLHADPSANRKESAKAAEREKEKQSNDLGSSSMNFSSKTDNGHSLGEKKKQELKDSLGGEEQFEVLNNALRLDTGVSGGEKSSAKVEDAIDQDQNDSNERLKVELNRKPQMSPHCEGDEANTAKKKNKAKKKSRRSPSSSEDESSSGDERRRRQKKRSKKRKRKHYKSSSSESSTDNDRRRRKRNRHKLEVVLDSPFLRVEDPPVNCEDSAKAAERKMEKQSNDGGSSSMNFASKVDNGHCPGDKTDPAPKEVLNNAPRLDTGVSAVEKSSAKGEDAIDQIHEKQIGSSEHLKGELKRKSETSPHGEGDEANTAKKTKKSKAEKKKSRRPPSSSEDESSSGDERRRKQKKRSKKRKGRQHKSSSSESSTDSDRHRRKRSKHKGRRRSASPKASDSGSR